jgi:hypothetical protein
VIPYRYCDYEDYPCCGHTDQDAESPYADMTDEEIKQMVYDRDPDDYDQSDYYA